MPLAIDRIPFVFRRLRLVLPVVFALASLTVGATRSAHAQGDIEKTPWASTMVYPVGDPLDFGRAAPGEANGFTVARGVNLSRRGDRHEGIDLFNHARGSEVRAVAPGLVVCTRTGFGGGWGNMVVLAHRLPGGDVLFSLVAHLMPGSIRVHEGEIVALGQPLGRVGSTGHSSGPHLHIEFRSLASSLLSLGTPLSDSWQRASVVDPLRIFSAMLPEGSAQKLFLPADDAYPAGNVPADALGALLERGGLTEASGLRADEALTRGELYRIALATLSKPNTAVPARWTKVRDRLVQAARKLPSPAKESFARASLPAREGDARTPASLSETIQVFRALDVCRAAADGLARPLYAPTRASLETDFPHGLVAFESATSPSAAPAQNARAFGPPAVTRRQAALLWTWVEAGRSDATAATE